MPINIIGATHMNKIKYIPSALQDWFFYSQNPNMHEYLFQFWASALLGHSITHSICGKGISFDKTLEEKK